MTFFEKFKIGHENGGFWRDKNHGSRNWFFKGDLKSPLKWVGGAGILEWSKTGSRNWPSLKMSGMDFGVRKIMDPEIGHSRG